MLTRDDALEIIRRGNASRRLLADDDFVEVMNFLDQFHLSALVACPTGEAAKPTRDHHHERLHALRDIIGEMQARAQALDAFEEDQAGPSETDEDY